MHHSLQSSKLPLEATVANKHIGLFEISRGTGDTSVANPREMFIRALLCGANKIILIHNHPSGNPEPSHSDITVTKRVKECGCLLGVELLDHIIVGNSYCSLKTKNYF